MFFFAYINIIQIIKKLEKGVKLKIFNFVKEFSTYIVFVLIFVKSKNRKKK
jgi:hypothetical protein